ncbi:MAG: SseB family protein [Paracoccaceae bacterium]
MTATALDAAHAAMLAAPDDDLARLHYYQTLADGELVLVLNREAQGSELDPRLVGIDGLDCVLAFDSEERLAAFSPVPVPYAALPGRVIVAVLAGQGAGIAVNLGEASSWMVTPEAVDWLADALQSRPPVRVGRPADYAAPDLPAPVIAALAAPLRHASGLAERAVLAAVRYRDGGEGHLLAFVSTRPEAQAALARAVSEAVVFSGQPEVVLDVAFLSATAPELAAMDDVGLALAIARRLPAPQAARPRTPAAPGSDPEKPPILR